MRIRALFTKSTTTLGLVEQAFWRVPLFTKWVVASSFEVILQAIETFYHWDSCLWDFGFSTDFSHSAAWENWGERFGCFIFARLFISWRKLQLSPFTHCPLVSIANNLQEFFVHAVLFPDKWKKAFFSKFPFLFPKFLLWNFLLDTSLHHSFQSVIINF